MSISIKKLIIPALWAGMILGLSNHAMGALSFTNVIDSMGRQWGTPFSVAPGTYLEQYEEITSAGYTAASIEDVISMYLEKFGADGSDPFWSAYVSAFGLSSIFARTATVAPTIQDLSAHRITGEYPTVVVVSPRYLDDGVTGTLSAAVVDAANVDFLPTGFMFFLAPEPTLTLLFGGSLMGLGYMAYRRKKALA